jgi:hypothetical protein
LFVIDDAKKQVTTINPNTSALAVFTKYGDWAPPAPVAFMA